MRIALDAKRAYNNYRGLGQYSRQLIAGLHEIENAPDLDLITTGKGAILPDFNESNLRTIRSSWPFFQSLWSSRKAGNVALNSGAQIYHGLSNEIPLIPSGLRSVVTIHDVIFLQQPHLYPIIDRNIYKAKVKSALKRADVVVTTSDQTTADIKQFFPEIKANYKTVYQCADPTFFESQDVEIPELPTEFVLCVGSIEERKNQLSVFKAISKIRPELSLVLVGSGKSYLKDIKFWAKKNGLLNKLLHLEGINNAQLAQVYRKAALLAYPSLHEGFGIPLAEAMACGTPILTSTGGVFEEIAQGAATYCDPYSVESIASGIDSILSDQDRTSQKVEIGKERSGQFTRAKFASNMMEVYTSVIGK